ncbi:MAG TPA: hypothetical protein VK630_01195 [Reyranella sp.]|nr:hypothetical protein [Reyranella sp.]
MPSVANVILCAATMAVVWTTIGWPIAARLLARPATWWWAPAFGFALHCVIALPVLGLTGMNQPAVIVLTIAIAVLSFAVSRQRGAFIDAVADRCELSAPALIAALVGAALLALLPAAAVLPKTTADGMTLSASIFDHSKIAMIDEMIRSGVPAHNPFFSESGAPDRLTYYYLWHFGAAIFAVATGATGWEADTALTWFTAFASLLAMIGLALRLGGKTAAPFIVLVLAASASIRTVLDALAPDGANYYLRGASGFAGWLFQGAWAPQHLASTTCVVLATLLLVRVAEPGAWLAAAALALVAAAGFETSIWVGGLTFAVAASAISLRILWSLPPGIRAGFVLRLAAAATLALALCFPFLRDQVAAAAARGGGAPIAIAPVEVLGPAFPASWQALLDLPAYWLVYLPVEFTAFYPAGLIALSVLWRARAGCARAGAVVPAVTILLIASLVIAWLLRSVIAHNNDLGWRAILPAILLLVVFAAVLISRGIDTAGAPRIAGLMAALGILLTFPETLQFAREDIFASRTPSERLFAEMPALWDAVRRQTPPDERVANNPGFLADMTPWGINISWALMANRRSCYAAHDFAIAFAPLSAAQRAAVDERFKRVFAGAPAEDDIQQLSARLHCDTIVVTPQDGAWQRDPFASGEAYHLVDSRDDRWRIYRRVGAQMPLNQLKPRSSQ